MELCGHRARINRKAVYSVDIMVVAFSFPTIFGCNTTLPLK